MKNKAERITEAKTMNANSISILVILDFTTILCKDSILLEFF